MWTPIELKLNNFMVYETEVIKFNTQPATIIQGLNITDERFENNGSGKSSVLEGLSVALLNTTLRSSTTVKDLIRRGCDSTQLELSLRNSRSKETMVITREFFNNTKPSTLSISINGKVEENIISV